MKFNSQLFIHRKSSVRAVLAHIIASEEAMPCNSAVLSISLPPTHKNSSYDQMNTWESCWWQTVVWNERKAKSGLNMLTSGVRDPSPELSRWSSSDMFSKGCWWLVLHYSCQKFIQLLRVLVCRSFTSCQPLLLASATIFFYTFFTLFYKIWRLLSSKEFSHPQWGCLTAVSFLLPLVQLDFLLQFHRNVSYFDSTVWLNHTSTSGFKLILNALV